MLNYLWSGMILIGVLWGAFHGQLAAVTEGALTSAKEAVTLCITMLGVMTLWTGVLEVGKRAGLIDQLSRRMRPVLRFLFPRLSPESEAGQEVAALHRRWLTVTGNPYDPAKHRGIAALYVQDPRFTAYYDKAVPGCARFLCEAVACWVK